MKRNFERQIQWLLKEKYDNKRSPRFFRDSQRLKKGEPVAYLIGWQPFLNCKIDLSLRSFIPEPETEYWTEKAIEIIKNSKLKVKSHNRTKIADVFSGSGCIGVAVLKNVKNAQVDFYEIDKKALKQIKINLRINGILASRCRVISGDAFKKLKKDYDFILANPPYLTPRRKTAIQPAVYKYEPLNALFGGNDGLLYIKKLLCLARHHLKRDGQIWMEFDSWQKKEIEKLLKKFGYRRWQFFRDQYGCWRYVQIFY